MTETKHAEVKGEHKDLFWQLLPLSNEEGYQILADWQAEVERKVRLDEARRAWHDYSAAPHQCINPIGTCYKCNRIRELEGTK